MKRTSIVSFWAEPGVKQYATVSLAAAAIVGVVLFQRTGEIVALIPVLAGLLGGLGGFSPMIFVLAVAVALNATGFVEPLGSRHLLLDVVLCMAVLAFVAAQYRLQSLLLHIFPLDPRDRIDAPPPKPWLGLIRRKPRVRRVCRLPSLVNNHEIVNLLWVLPFSALVACFLLLSIPLNDNLLNLPAPIWQGMVLAWLFGVNWFVVSGVLEYFRYRRMTRDEAAVCLQDMVWNETRREQRRLNRWLAWQRLRSSRKTLS